MTEPLDAAALAELAAVVDSTQNIGITKDGARKLLATVAHWQARCEAAERERDVATLASDLMEHTDVEHQRAESYRVRYEASQDALREAMAENAANCERAEAAERERDGYLAKLRGQFQRTADFSEMWSDAEGERSAAERNLTECRAHAARLAGLLAEADAAIIPARPESYLHGKSAADVLKARIRQALAETGGTP